MRNDMSIYKVLRTFVIKMVDRIHLSLEYYPFICIDLYKLV